ncbi:MAG TPA: aldo/keto reductase [Candidatus Tetragenococcus pullicola]|nr:aldo/keto reductase [Candidatus Tetragenococcus pullicola]
MTIPMIQLADGNVIPAVGYGTAGTKGNVGTQAITAAIHNGYRHIDTAYNYENEGAVGQAIKRSGVAREKLFITSKLPGRYHEHDKAIEAIQESLYRADLDYFDLYLIHWPNPKRELYVEAWQALLDAQRFGLIRSVGVSNFLPEHLEKIDQETGVLPVINQIELHPLLSQKEQRAFNAKHNILIEAWSPLGGTGSKNHQTILKNPDLVTLAKKYHKNVGQIILRWEYQLGVLPLPLSRNSERQASNLAIFDFELSKEEVEQITAMDNSETSKNAANPDEHEEL